MKRSLLILITLSLTACGGGSSGGGGNEAGANAQQAPQPAPAPAPAPPQTTTYNGTGTITATAPGFVPISENFAVQVVVQGSMVTVTVDGESVSAPLNNGMFSVNVPIAESSDGITCTGSASVNGTVNGNTVAGSIAGGGTCAGNGVNLPVTLSGSFTAQS